MTNEEIKWVLKQDWNDDKDIEAEKIAEVMFEVTSRIDKEAENIKYRTDFSQALKKLEVLNTPKSTVVKTKWDFLWNKQEEEVEEILLKRSLTYLAETNLHLFEKALSQRTEVQNTKELIRLQLAEYYDYYKDNYSSRSIKTVAEASTIALFIRGYTAGSSKRILDQMDMKDTNHHNRDLKTSKYKEDKNFNEKMTEREYWNIIKEQIYNSLRSDGTGEDRANRLSTYTIKIIKEINTKL